MAPKNSGKPSALSEEYVVDSSDDQEVAHSDQAKNADAQMVSNTSSKQRSLAKASEHPKRKPTSPSRESSSRSQSLEEDGQVDEEDEDEPGVADLLDDSAKQGSSKSSSGKEPPRKRPKTIPAPERSIPAKTYDPPPGFVRRPAVDTESASQASQFLNGELSGKQVWHITAPAGVSLESIKSFGIYAARKGETVLKSDGKSYRFAEEPTANKCLLTPNDREDEYLQGKVVISRTYHLREIINPPAKSRETETKRSKPVYFEFQPGDELPVRTKREQPKGLRMRYKPFGTKEASPEGSDAEHSRIYIPDEVPAPTEDSHERGKKKLPRRRKSPVAEDTDAVEAEPSQIPPNSKTTSPQSNKHPHSSPMKDVAAEKGSAGQEKSKKRSKKRKDQEVSLT